MLTASGKPRRAKTMSEAILILSLPPTEFRVPLECSLRDTIVMTAVPAMQANTMKLLIAQTTLEPNRWHIGSMRKELIPRTTFADQKEF